MNLSNPASAKLSTCCKLPSKNVPIAEKPIPIPTLYPPDPAAGPPAADPATPIAEGNPRAETDSCCSFNCISCCILS